MLRLMAVVMFLFTPYAYGKICEGYGPQTPRDLTSKAGTNPVTWSKATSHKNMNLCNIHFHKNAEHKAKGFSMSGGKGDFGGWKCNETKSLSKAQMKKLDKPVCTNLNAGDTIEVHWVYTSCDVKPGKGLGACLSAACANPQLRVETKVFVLTNDKKGTMFPDYAKLTKKAGKHQVTKKPDRSDALEFLGSTTGPSYTEAKCSPLQVTWNVSQTCETLDVASVGKWCSKNVFEEKKAHGVRQIVKSKKLLSPIN